MEATFKGKYYNGLSSMGLEAEIALESHAILIAYTDKDGEPQTIAWDIAQMHKNEFIAKDRVTLQYGTFPPQSLEVNSAAFVIALKTTYAHQDFMQSHYHFLSKKGWKGVIAGGTLCVSLIAIFYFVGIPTIAEGIAEKFPLKYEVEIGEQLFKTVTKQYQIDSVKTVLMNDFYKNLAYPSNYDIKVTVVEVDMVNAFAVLGGNIVVFTGILDKMQNSNELAALLAHEASHIELRHSTKSMFRSLANYMFISLIFYDVNAIASLLVENANMLTDLHYSRRLEQEADENGFRLMVGQQIDPNGMVQLFETLKDGHKIKVKIPDTENKEIGENDEAAEQEIEISEPNEFMSTHPLIANRIDDIRQMIAKNPSPIKENNILSEIWNKIKGINE